MIHRRLDNNLLVGSGKDVYSQSDALDDTGNERHPLSFDLPLVMRPYPVDYRSPELIGHDGIAEERVVEAFAKGIGNELRCGEVHIGHPKRQEVVTTPSWQQSTMLEIATPRTVDDGVEHSLPALGSDGRLRIIVIF